MMHFDNWSVSISFSEERRSMASNTRASIKKLTFVTRFQLNSSSLTSKKVIQQAYKGPKEGKFLKESFS